MLKPTLEGNAAEWESKLFQERNLNPNMNIVSDKVKHTTYILTIHVVFHLSPKDGTYTLKAFDENYEPYLKSLGVPGFVVPIILRASETITVIATEKGATMITETGEAKQIPRGLTVTYLGFQAGKLKSSHTNGTKCGT